jgi:hypothetical protein
MQWIQKNSGRKASLYTTTLSTCADHLRETSLKELLEESEELQTPLNSCRGRYHSLIHDDREEHSQATEKMLEKIQNTVRMNGEEHCTNLIYEEAQRKIREELMKNIAFGVARGNRCCSGSGRSSTGRSTCPYTCRNFVVGVGAMMWTGAGFMFIINCFRMQMERTKQMDQSRTVLL